MTINVPWWFKILAKLILSRLPFGYSIWQKLGFFRHGSMDSSAYAIRVFNRHVDKYALRENLKGKMLLELGPGDSIATAIIASAYGASAILVDAGRFVREDVIPYLNLSKELSKQGLNPADISSCKNIDEILVKCKAVYMTEGLKSFKEIKSNAVDFVFSQAVLEHVYRHEFFDTMIECCRIIKSDGLASHQIDLRDHLGGSLNNLRFDEKTWEASYFAKKSGFYTNRIQFTQMLEFFKKAGFEVQVTDVQRWDSLPLKRAQLAIKFKSISDEELCISSFDVLLRKI